MRLGVMGGTFDPIHIGHLIAAEEVRCSLKLERILFVPAGEPPHKKAVEVSAASHRVRMVELAIASNPHFELSLLDVERPGKSYTVDMMAALGRQLGPQAELFFIVGMDSLAELATWREPARLLSLCRLAVVNRRAEQADLSALEASLPHVAQRVERVEMPGIDISATDLRSRVARGLPIRYQVPEAVEHYIRDAGLYSVNPRRTNSPKIRAPSAKR